MMTTATTMMTMATTTTTTHIVAIAVGIALVVKRWRTIGEDILVSALLFCLEL